MKKVENNMENKKGNLSTVFLVIAIILIVAMGALLYMQKTESDKQIAELENNASKLQETIDNFQGKIDSISDTKNDNGDTSTSEKKSTQFDAEFWELKDIAKEYRDFDKVKNYKDFNYDLDGDGKIDKITLRHIVNEDEEEYSSERDYYILQYNGEKFEEYLFGRTIYIVDLNENDKNIEVVIYDAGPSDDPNYTIYSKNGNEMVELKNIDGYPLKSDKKGTILVGDSFDRGVNGATTPEIYFQYHIIKDGKIEVKNADIEKIKEIELKTSHLYFSKDYKNQNKLFEELGEKYDNVDAAFKGLGIEQLKESTTFKIKDFKLIPNEYNGFDYEVYVELSDGRKGYIFHIQWAG